MNLKERYEKEDFLAVTEEVFKKTYPRDEELSLMYTFFKKRSQEELKSENPDVSVIYRLRTISNSFLAPLIRKEFKDKIQTIEKFVQTNKLKQVDNLSYNVVDDKILFFENGNFIFSVDHLGGVSILKKVLSIYVPEVMVSLSDDERDGIFQAYLGYCIGKYRKIKKS